MKFAAISTEPIRSVSILHSMIYQSKISPWSEFFLLGSFLFMSKMHRATATWGFWGASYPSPRTVP
eukprot:scaffold37720_cov147-Skeletonema_marinoi.AAC.9